MHANAEGGRRVSEGSGATAMPSSALLYAGLRVMTDWLWTYAMGDLCDLTFCLLHKILHQDL